MLSMVDPIGPTPGIVGQPPADIIVSMPLHQLGVDLFEARFDGGILSRLEAEEVSASSGRLVVLEDPLDERVDVLACRLGQRCRTRPHSF